jgi:hypothetical protein
MKGIRSGEKYHDAIYHALGVAYVQRPERIERGRDHAVRSERTK